VTYIGTGPKVNHFILTVNVQRHTNTYSRTTAVQSGRR